MPGISLSDQGTEASEPNILPLFGPVVGHEKYVHDRAGVDVNFAHPYHSWERGLNENTNGLIRQHFTKGSSFENITDDEVGAVMNKLNHFLRKTRNFKIPHTVFFAELLQEKLHEYQDCTSELNPRLNSGPCAQYKILDGAYIPNPVSNPNNEASSRYTILRFGNGVSWLG